MSQINDLLQDLEFIRWVKQPDDELNTFWKSWIQANPDNSKDVKLAREIILGMEFPSIVPSDQDKSEVLITILKEASLASSQKSIKDNSKPHSGSLQNWKFLRDFYDLRAF